MIGVSLPLPLLCGTPADAAQQSLHDSYGSPQAMLASLRARGVASIELRGVAQETDPAVALEAAGAVRQAGLHMTIHASLYPAPPEAFFGCIQPLLPEQADPPVCLTVHTMRAFGAENRVQSTAQLARWGRYALDHGIPVRFALENNRIGNDPLEVTACPDIAGIVREIDLPNVGVCWDFGHLYSDFQRFPDRTPEMLPPEPFAQRAVHTHIHGVRGQTHFPLLGPEDLPLRAYLEVLRANGYRGILNLELDFYRFHARHDPRDALERSVDCLRRAADDLGLA